MRAAGASLALALVGFIGVVGAQPADAPATGDTEVEVTFDGDDEIPVGESADEEVEVTFDDDDDLTASETFTPLPENEMLRWLVALPLTGVLLLAWNVRWRPPAKRRSVPPDKKDNDSHDS